MGPVFFLLGIIPAVVEAMVDAAFGRSLFDMPTNLSYAFGFLLASAGMTVIIPAIFGLLKRGFKVRKTIIHLLIISSTIDNLFTGTLFSALTSLYV